MASICLLPFQEGRILPFDEYLYQLQLEFSKKCPDSPYLALLEDGPRVFTMDTARALTGSPAGWFASIWTFTPYPTDLIFARFQAWKLPMIQLIMSFPRAPHGTSVEAFSIFHLMGSPVDTIASLIFTLHTTQRRVRILENNPNLTKKAIFELVLLINTFEECGDELRARRLEELFASNKLRYNENYATAAHALAADRTTKLLPVLINVLAFLASIALSYAKLATSAWDLRSPRQIDIYGIAFSMTLAACVPAVMLAAAVGVPQSSMSARRILGQFLATERGVDGFYAQSLDVCLLHGAVPSWRPDRWRWAPESLDMSAARKYAVKRGLRHEVSAILLTSIGSIGAIVLSSRVPPGGCMNCRIFCEMIICLTYICSYVVGVVLATLFRDRRRAKLLFWLTMIKDICAAGVVAAVILVTVCGSLNRVGCWQSCSGDKLELPSVTRPLLEAMPAWEFPVIIFTTLASLVALGAGVAWSLWDGVSVYLQRDDHEDRLLSRRRSDASTTSLGLF